METKPQPGAVRTEFNEQTQIVMVDGIQVLVLDDPRPEAVAAFDWMHEGVLFDVLASPHGNEGGFKLDAALDVVRALNAAR